MAAEEFQVWTLTVRRDRTASLVGEDGNDKIVFTKEISFTGFPRQSVTLRLANNTIYLLSEQ